jgi:hypothetical protein
MASSLSDVLLDRLQRETKAPDDWPELVQAALAGEAAVDADRSCEPGAVRGAYQHEGDRTMAL